MRSAGQAGGQCTRVGCLWPPPAPTYCAHATIWGKVGDCLMRGCCMIVLGERCAGGGGRSVKCPSLPACGWPNYSMALPCTISLWDVSPVSQPTVKRGAAAPPPGAKSACRRRRCCCLLPFALASSAILLSLATCPGGTEDGAHPQSLGSMPAPSPQFGRGMLSCRPYGTFDRLEYLAIQQMVCCKPALTAALWTTPADHLTSKLDAESLTPSPRMAGPTSC